MARPTNPTLTPDSDVNNMANSTDEYWSINNVSLHQYGWAVTTFGGARYDVPARRGENIRLAYRPGTAFRPKLADERVITLNFFLIGMLPNGQYPPNMDMRLQWNDSWDFIRRLVWQIEGQQFELVRRWRLTPPPIPADLQNYHVSQRDLFGTSSKMLWANSMAELAGTMTPTMTGRIRSEFTMDLLLTSPYFGGYVESVPLNPGVVQRIFNPGHDLACYHNCYIDLYGPLSKPRITNFSQEPNIWVQYDDDIAAGQHVRIYVHNWYAIDQDTSKNLTANITHSGARHYFVLFPGDNQVRLNATGSGHAQVNFKPPYV